MMAVKRALWRWPLWGSIRDHYWGLVKSSSDPRRTSGRTDGGADLQIAARLGTGGVGGTRDLEYQRLWVASDPLGHHHGHQLSSQVDAFGAAQVKR